MCGRPEARCKDEALHEDPCWTGWWESWVRTSSGLFVVYSQLFTDGLNVGEETDQRDGPTHGG